MNEKKLIGKELWKGDRVWGWKWYEGRYGMVNAG